MICETVFISYLDEENKTKSGFFEIVSLDKLIVFKTEKNTIENPNLLK